MKNINEIMDDAYLFTNHLYNSKKYTTNQNLLSYSNEKDIFPNPAIKIYIENLIAGALLTYHEEIRNTLLKQGIEIEQIIDIED